MLEKFFIGVYGFNVLPEEVEGWPGKSIGRPKGESIVNLLVEEYKGHHKIIRNFYQDVTNVEF